MRLSDKLPGERVFIKGGKIDPVDHWGTVLEFKTNKRGTLFAVVQRDDREKKSTYRATRKVLK